MNPARAQKTAPLQNLSFSLPPDLEKAVSAARLTWDAANNTARLWNKDASLWTNSDESQWLGWLNIVDLQLSDTAEFKALAAEIREDGFTHVVLLGMGGSSLCPEVFASTFGKQTNAPELLILDSTDPAYIRRLRQRIDPARTLFCVASKSGSTLEPNLYLQYFYDETRKLVGDHPGRHFIAITDAGSPLERTAIESGFRRLFHGDPTIGGRYSALSDFGLVPHAASGLDTEQFLKLASVMVQACKEPSSVANPGVSLGLVLGTAAARGRDKVTLLCSRSIYGLGAWLEQLLAESTGKDGRGLVPVDREPLFGSDTSVYSHDRLFAYINFIGDQDPELEAAAAAIEQSGQPVIRLVVNDLNELGQLFFLWEFATAVAASLLGVNAFNQPDVEASNLSIGDLNAAFEQSGFSPAEKPLIDHEGLQLFADPDNANAVTNGGNTLGSIFREHLDRIRPGDYFGLLAYIPMFSEQEAKLEHIRKHIIHSKHVATVLGFGPRFLHSTGQAYKGGPNTGVFLVITCDDSDDLPIPGHSYTFGSVKAAQARADFNVLSKRGRRALRIHLGPDLNSGLDRLHDLVSASLTH